MSTARETRSGRAAKVKKEEGGGDLPGAWAAYGRLLQHLRKRAGLNQQQLGEAIGYSMEQVASVEQGRRLYQGRVHAGGGPGVGGGRDSGGAPGGASKHASARSATGAEGW